MTSTTIVNLTDYNETNTKRRVELNYVGGPIAADAVQVNKFRIHTRTFPIFIPRIIEARTNDKVSYIKGYDEVNIKPRNDLNFYNYYHNKFDTDWSICVVNEKTKKFVNVEVMWKAQRNNLLRPLNFPERAQVLTNEYFHATNTIHVISLIQDALDVANRVLKEDHLLKIVKLEKTYQLLKLLTNETEEASDVRVFFNYNLLEAFNCYTTGNWLSAE